MKSLLSFFLSLLSFNAFTQYVSDSTELILQNGHRALLTHMQFSPSGEFIVKADKDRNVSILSTKTLLKQQAMTIDAEKLMAIRFSTNGQELYCIVKNGRDTDLEIYDWKSKKRVTEIRNFIPPSVKKFILLQQDKFLLIQTGYKQIMLYDLEQKKIVYTIEQNETFKKGIHALTVDEKTDMFFFLSKDAEKMTYVHLYKTSTGEHVKTISLGQKTPNKIIAKENQLIVLMKEEHQVYDRKKYKLRATFTSYGYIKNSRVTPFYYHPIRDELITLKGNKCLIQKMGSDTIFKSYRLPPLGLTTPYDFHPSVNLLALKQDHGDKASILLDINNGVIAHKSQHLYANIEELEQNHTSNLLFISGTSKRYFGAWNLENGSGYSSFLHQSSYATQFKRRIQQISYKAQDSSLYLCTNRNAYTYDLATHTHQKLENFQASTSIFDLKPHANFLVSSSLKNLYCYDLTHQSGVLIPKRRYINDFDIDQSGSLYYKDTGRFCKYTLSLQQQDTCLTDPNLHDFTDCIEINNKYKRMYSTASGYIFMNDLTTMNRLKSLHLDKRVLGLASSDDDERLLVVQKDGFQVYKAEYLQMMYERKGKTAEKIKRALFSHDQRFIFSLHKDGTLKIWKTATGELLATCLRFIDEEYLIITPDFYYLSSHKAIHRIGVKIKDQVYPVEQFDLKFNRPDIVLKRLGFASIDVLELFKKAHEKRIHSFGFAENELTYDQLIPKVTIKKYPYTAVDPYATLQIDAHGNGKKLKWLKVYNNDLPLNGIQGKPLFTNDTSITIDIPLIAGSNHVQVSVIDASGTESLRETASINCQQKKELPNLYLVTMAVSEHADTSINLKYPESDAKNIREALLERRHRYQNIYEHHALGKDMTRKNLTQLSAFLKDVRLNDVVIIFIAGHGVLTKDYQYFLSTYDMDQNHPQRKGIPYEEIENILGHVKSMNKLVLLDACYSGEIDKSVAYQKVKKISKTNTVTFRSLLHKNTQYLQGEKTFDLMKLLFADTRKGTGTTVLASSGGNEVSMESDTWKGGLFTYCLLDAFDDMKADLNNNRSISIAELRSHIYHLVTLLSNGRQRPSTREQNIFIDFNVY